MKKIIFATGNKDKMKEIRMILADLGMEVLSQKEAGIFADVVEDGKTFEENAIKKAKEIYEKTKIPTLADDSGIEIQYLNGWPGVMTSRFLGEDKTGNEYATERNKYILDKMKKLNKEERKVKHVTCIAYCDSNGVRVARGENIGYIALSPKGKNGFGFDEIFELEDGRTLAELDVEEKNKISSRKLALNKLKEYLGRDNK